MLSVLRGKNLVEGVREKPPFFSTTRRKLSKGN